MSKEYFCATDDDVEIINEDDKVVNFEFHEYSKIEAIDHEEAAQKFSQDIDNNSEIDFDGRDIYVKCAETGLVKKFHVSVSLDPMYFASEIEIGSDIVIGGESD